LLQHKTLGHFCLAFFCVPLLTIFTHLLPLGMQVHGRGKMRVLLLSGGAITRHHQRAARQASKKARRAFSIAWHSAVDGPGGSHGAENDMKSSKTWR